jgi:hypothetical protein
MLAMDLPVSLAMYWSGPASMLASLWIVWVLRWLCTAADSGCLCIGAALAWRSCSPGLWLTLRGPGSALAGSGWACY